MQDATGTKVAADLAEAKKKVMQQIMSWNLPDAKAKDIIFLAHSQLRRKVKRVQAFYVRPLSHSPGSAPVCQSSSSSPLTTLAFDLAGVNCLPGRVDSS